MLRGGGREDGSRSRGRGGEFEEPRSEDRNAACSATEEEKDGGVGVARATFYNPAKCETRAPF